MFRIIISSFTFIILKTQFTTIEYTIIINPIIDIDRYRRRSREECDGREKGRRGGNLPFPHFDGVIDRPCDDMF